MDPTLRERLAAMVAAYEEMRSAPDRDDAGPEWQSAHERYCVVTGHVPGHLGLARLVLELDAEVERLRAEVAEARAMGRLEGAEAMRDECSSYGLANVVALPDPEAVVAAMDEGKEGTG